MYQAGGQPASRNDVVLVKFTSSDKHCLRVWVQQHRWMDEQLMVDELISFCTLSLAIQQ